MGKRIFLGLLAFMAVVSLYADELTPEQKAFRSSIMTFLREEGFVPSIDDDNSLTFKKEGVLYWIDVAENSPFYAELHRIGLKCNNANSNNILQACNETNKKVKCVKAIMGEGTLAFVIEQYCHSAEDFKYTFYKNIKELDNAYSTLVDKYNQLDGETSSMPFVITSSDVANVERNGNIITGYGKTIYDFKTKYLKPKVNVRVNSPGTYDIYVKFYTPSGELSTGTDSPSGYSWKNSVTMEQGEHFYTLSGWGSATAGHWKMGTYRIEYYYNGKLIGNKSFEVK